MTSIGETAVSVLLPLFLKTSAVLGLASFAMAIAVRSSGKLQAVVGRTAALFLCVLTVGALFVPRQGAITIETGVPLPVVDAGSFGTAALLPVEAESTPFEGMDSSLAIETAQDPEPVPLQLFSQGSGRGLLGWILAGVVVVWVLGALAQACRTVVALARLLRLKTESTPLEALASYLDPDILESVGTRAPALESARITIPISFGLLRPVVVLPAALDIQPYQQREVLVHELVHVKHRDFAWLLLMRVLQIVHWYNPVFRHFSDRFELAQERSCDEKTVEILGDRMGYCELLASYAHIGFARPHLLAPAVSGTASSIRRRIDGLASHDDTGGIKRRTGISIAFVAVISAVLAITNCSGTPSVVDIPLDPTLGADQSQTTLISDEVPDFVKAIEAHRSRIPDLGEILLTDGNSYRVELPENPYGADYLLIEPVLHASHFIMTLDVYGDSVSMAGPTRHMGSYEGGVNTGFSAGDGRISISVRDADRIGADQLRVDLYAGMEAEYNREDLVTFIENLEQYLEYKSSESIEDRLAYDSFMMSQAISRSRTRPRSLVDDAEALATILRPDPYSLKGEPYRFEAGDSYYALSSVGPDGVAGTGDDPVSLTVRRGSWSRHSDGTRAELWDEEADTWIVLTADWP